MARKFTLVRSIVTPIGYLTTFLLITAMLPSGQRNYGLDTPQAIGAYLNGIFPTVTPSPGEGAWKLTDAFPNLDFVTPIHLEQEPGTNRLFVGEHIGKIQVFDKNRQADQKSELLDISDKIWNNGESGLLCFTFHPQYGIENQYLYVSYQYRGPSGQGYTRVSRFTVPQDGSAIDVDTELVMIQQRDQASNHNGGALLFGPDGYLYISTGDEGGGNNQYRNSQSLDDRLHGGVLRIDVDMNPATSHPIRRQPRKINNADISFTDNYYIPNDNPFLDPDGGILEEFYAVGLRNPHRMTINPLTNEIWIGDVGQGRREEISLLSRGGNFQWGYKEGELDGPQGKPNPLIGTDQEPIYTYGHNNGNNCIIGGYVYNGNRLPSLSDRYIFADNGSRRIWALNYNEENPGSTTAEELLIANVGGGYNGISAFAVDRTNELYILTFNGQNRGGGKIFILDREQAPSPEPPGLLSETGAFTDLQNLTPAPGIIPYQPNVPFWSDGASKQRWVAIPNDGTHNDPSEQIVFSEEGIWEFPKGAVFIKHFELPVDLQNPGQTRRLETRFMVHGEDGNYFGFTYKWLPDRSDAVLLTDSLTESIEVKDLDGDNTIQKWYYPNREECLTCHKEESGSVLGLNTRQLNGEIIYPLTGNQANQLATLNSLGIFTPTLNEAQIADYLTMVPLADESQPLEVRARSYLDANCAYCHNPFTGVLAGFDTRFTVPLANQGIINGLLRDNLGIGENRVLVPGDTVHSVLYTRMKIFDDDLAMPPLAKNKLDQQGISLIKDWIISMTQKLQQTISFDPIPNKLVNDPPFIIETTANSGLPVTLTLVSGPATLVDNQVTLTGEPGMVVIEASQPGNEEYEAAEPIRQTFSVIPNEPEACPPIDLSEKEINSFGFFQDKGMMAFTEAEELFISENAWKSIPFDYEVTSETILEFEFKSDSQGEIHGIGLDDNNWQTQRYTFQLYGTQEWGLQNFHTYSGEGYQTFVIPIGAYYTGSFDRIFFIMDHDKGEATGTSYFRNIKVYDGDCNQLTIPQTVAPFCIGGNETEWTIEAEHFSEYAPSYNRDWQLLDDASASNGEALFAIGRGYNTLLNPTGPVVRYPLQFEQTGTYYISVRTKSNSESDNSVHLGIDGSCLTCESGQGVGMIGREWQWAQTIQQNGNYITFEIENLGLHMLSMWMREDGIWVDKLILQKELTPVPGAGPEEVLRCDEVTSQNTQSSPIPAQGSLHQDLQRFQIRLFPNPVTDKLYIDLSTYDKAQIILQLMDVQGKVLQTNQLSTPQASTLQHSLSMSSLSKGIYLLSIYDVNSGATIATHKIFKQ